MNARSNARGDPTDGCGADAVRRELSRILDSPGFAASPQLRAFLTYVVERRLEGQSERIKGYTIATEALGRDPSFDPSADPIVRVEGARLRRLLADHFEGPGKDDPIRVEIPKGGYIPQFSRKEAADAPSDTRPAAHAPGHVPGLVPGLAPALRRSPLASSAIAGAFVLLLALVAYLIYRPLPTPSASPDAMPPSLAVAIPPAETDAGPGSSRGSFKGEMPVVHVAAIEEDPATTLPAGFSGTNLHDKLAAALGRFDEIGVTDDPDAADYRLDGHVASDQGPALPQLPPRLPAKRRDRLVLAVRRGGRRRDARPAAGTGRPQCGDRHRPALWRHLQPCRGAGRRKPRPERRRRFRRGRRRCRRRGGRTGLRAADVYRAAAFFPPT